MRLSAAVRAAALAVLCAHAGGALAQPAARAEAVGRVLEETKALSVLGGVAGEVAWALDEPVPGVPPLSADVRGLVERHFADTTLYRYVREEMTARADDATLAALGAWLFSDWAREMQRTADAEPGESLEAYARGLRAHPPSETRARLMVRYVQANSPGLFFVGRDEALRAAVRDIRVATGMGATELEPEPAGDERAARVRQYDVGALVSFLQRYEAVSDAEFQRLVEAYESPSGRWYVRAYSESIAAAIRRAGLEAVAELRDGR